MRNLLIIICLLVFTSCMNVIGFALGIKKPKPKTEAQVIKYLDKRDYSTENIYSISFEAIDDLIKGLDGLPEMRAFNSEGEYVPYLAIDQTECSSRPIEFIEGLEPDKEYRTVDSLNLKTEISKLRTLQGQPIEFDNLPKADFYILAYWGTFLGRLNKMKIMEWEEQVREEEINNLPIFL